MKGSKYLIGDKLLKNIEQMKSKSKLNLNHFDLKIGSFNTLKGKIIVMAIIPIVAIMILAIMVLSVLSSTSRDYDLMATMDEIKNIQNQNQVLNEGYYCSLNNSAWYNMSENLKLMKEKAQAIQNQAGIGMRKEINEISEVIELNDENVNQIIEKNTQRGFNNGEGLLQEFTKNDGELQNVLHSAQWDSSWIELHMDSITNFNGESVSIEENNYYKAQYVGQLPKQGKRNQLVVRMGTIDLQYANDVYINNIVLSNATEQVTLELGALTVDDLAGTSGAISSYELARFNGKDSVKVNANFNTVDGGWQELSVYLPIAHLDLTKYDTISYDIYTVGEILYSVSLGSSLQSRYSFVDKYYEISGSVDAYNRAIAKGDINWEVEGSEAKTLINGLLSGLIEIEQNLAAYIIDEAFVNHASSLVLQKIAALEKLQQKDEEILTLKVNKVNLEEQLVQNINQVREEIQNNINSRKLLVQVLVVVITIVLIVLITIAVVLIVKSLNSSIKSFSATLDEMAKGNLTVRCDSSSKDEFSLFAGSLNTFSNKLCYVLNDIQVLVNDVEQKNRLFGQLFKQITEGA